MLATLNYGDDTTVINVVLHTADVSVTGWLIDKFCGKAASDRQNDIRQYVIVIVPAEIFTMFHTDRLSFISIVVFCF